MVDPSGELLAVRTRPTPATRGPAEVMRTAAELVRELAELGGGAGSGGGVKPGHAGPGGPGPDGGPGTVTAVGVGSAGVVDPRRGVVVSATGAIAGWAGTDLRGELSRALGLPVAVDNDVHAHALGEQWRGAAAGYRDVLLVAAGTGIGASLLLGGRVRHGAHSAAGHAGHLPVAAAAGRPCPCGGRGHVEAVASGPALLAEYRRRAAAVHTGEAAVPGPRAAAAEVARRDEVTHLAEVARLAEAGDPVAAAVLTEGATALGSAIGGLLNVIDPEIVVVGGGVAGCGALWWDALLEAVSAEALPALRDIPVEPAALGGAAALLGAARLVLEPER
nr:ROK family protein [Planomonospora venezuelensis]